MSQVLSFADLVLAAEEWRRDGAAIVLACGCFDPLHVGHVQHLKAAKELGNVLVVAVTADAFVNKGPGRPRSPAEHRAEVVASLGCVDAAVISHSDMFGSLWVIDALRPHVFVKGVEYRERKTPQLLAEDAAMRAFGGRVEFVTGKVVCSSTAILGV